MNQPNNLAGVYRQYAEQSRRMSQAAACDSLRLKHLKDAELFDVIATNMKFPEPDRTGVVVNFKPQGRI